MLTIRLYAIVMAAAFAGALPSQSVPSAFSVDVLVQQGFVRPGDLCFLPDHRVLVADLPGQVRLFVESAGASVTTVGTVPNVASGGERGLLSIIADPDFADNGYIYVLYTSSAGPDLFLDRYTCTGDLDNPTSTNLAFSAGSRRVILSLPQTSNIHSGGSVRFGPDDKLYVTAGDDFNPCNAQDITSQSGCLLRLDCSQLSSSPSNSPPSFAALDPGDNPLSGTGGFQRLVLAIGFRNPFRMEIDGATGNVYIGDVGDAAQEELNEYVFQPGTWTVANYGWPWREGTATGSGCSGGQPSGLVDPIASFTHGPGGRSIVNGAFYRNQGGASDFGAAYERSLFCLDIFVGDIQRLVETGGVWQQAPPEPGQPSASAWASGLSFLVSLRTGPDGALWFVEHAFSYPTPILGRIRPNPTRSVQVAGGNPQIGPAGEALPDPLVVQVRDLQGAPLPGVDVYFTPSPGAVVTNTGPVTADANGFAQTTVSAPLAGGPFSVTAASPSSLASAEFDLFSRRLEADVTAQNLTVSIDNRTSASVTQVPYVVMLSFPGSPTLPTIVGPLCIDPTYALAVVIEDGVGAFGNVSFSGAGGIGNPGLARSYPVPPGLFTGQLMRFQAVGFDAVGGWFRTNCESWQF